MRSRPYRLISLSLLLITIHAFTTHAEDLRKIIVATDASLPPMEFMDHRGNIKGFDIDIMNAIAKEAGFKVEYRNTKWNSIFPGIDSSRFNAAISCIIITRERSRIYTFSQPYADMGQVLVVPGDIVVKGVGNIKDIKDMVIGVKLGSTGAYMAERLGFIRPKKYRNLSKAFRDMNNGKLHGIICSLIKAGYYANYKKASKGKFVILGKQITHAPCGIVVRKGNIRVLNLVNKGIESIKKKGIDKQIYDKWFGTVPAGRQNLVPGIH